MLKVQKKDEKVWLDLDSFYPPDHKRPNTVFKSLVIALRSIGSDLTYEMLMGISGAAFRIQLHEQWCPSSPHPDCGFNCTEVAKRILNLDANTRTFNYTKDISDFVLNVIMTSINKGIPVIASSYETGIVVGYLKKKNEIILLYREPYSNVGDNPLACKIVPARYVVLDSIPQNPNIQSYKNSLQTTVQLANSPVIDKYHIGFAAYEKWILELVDELKMKKLRKIGEPELSNQNAHIFYSLLDARRCASQYLMNINNILGEKFNAPLLEAARYYKQVAEILEKGMQFIVWDWEFAKGVKWTKEQRIAQADILQHAFTLERKGIVEIKNYLAAIGYNK